MTSTARKSTNEMRPEPTKSSASDVRYWNWERICAPTSRRHSRTGSTTLYHEREADQECERVERRRVVELEDERAEHERQDPAEDQVVRRAAEVEGEPVALRVERPGQVGGDRAVADAKPELLPLEDVDGHDH